MNTDKMTTGAQIQQCYENTGLMREFAARSGKRVECYSIEQHDLVAIMKLNGDNSGQNKVMSVFDGANDPGKGAISQRFGDDEIKRDYFGVNTSPPPSGTGVNYRRDGLAIQVGGIANVINHDKEAILAGERLVVDIKDVNARTTKKMLYFRKYDPAANNPRGPDNAVNIKAKAMVDARPGQVMQVKLYD